MNKNVLCAESLRVLVVQSYPIDNQGAFLAAEHSQSQECRPRFNSQESSLVS